MKRRAGSDTVPDSARCLLQPDHISHRDTEEEKAPDLERKIPACSSSRESRGQGRHLQRRRGFVYVGAMQHSFCRRVADEAYRVEADYVGLTSGNDAPDKLERSGLHVDRNELWTHL